MGEVTLRKAYDGVIRVFSKREGIMENFEWIMMCAAFYGIFIVDRVFSAAWRMYWCLVNGNKLLTNYM